MYNVFRKIHLYSGLIILMFLTMYFVSGYVMAHRSWLLPRPPAPKQQTVTLDVGQHPSAPRAGGLREESLALPGRIQFSRPQPPDETLFWVVCVRAAAIRVDVFPQNHTIETDHATRMDRKPDHTSQNRRLQQRTAVRPILFLFRPGWPFDDSLCPDRRLPLVEAVKNHALGIVSS